MADQPMCGLARCADRGEKDPDEQRDNGDDHQQLDQRKGATALADTSAYLPGMVPLESQRSPRIVDCVLLLVHPDSSQKSSLSRQFDAPSDGVEPYSRRIPLVEW